MTLTIRCAWCRADGIVTILQQGDEPGISDGICAYHQTQLYAESFENHLHAHPEEVQRLTGETS